MTITELNIPCVWGGTLTGVLLKNNSAADDQLNQTTTKMIGIHGWMDNLNSLLPVAQKLIERHPNYEIYLYDRAGHGFSSHIPKGFDYSASHNVQDIRTIVQTLGWNKEKISFIGHSFGAILGTIYAASYAKEVLCIVAIDALPRAEITPDKLFEVHGSRIDTNLQFYNKPNRTFNTDLTFESAFSLQCTRPGITDEAAKLLTERSVRREADNKLHFTRDEALKLLSPLTFLEVTVESIVRSIKAPILYIGATNPQWPAPQKTIDLLKEQHPNFEMTLIDGPHHLHMTHVDEVDEQIEQYFNKYLPQIPTSDDQ